MHKLGVIVPYRNRFEQLTLFKEKIVYKINLAHPFFTRFEKLKKEEQKLSDICGKDEYDIKQFTIKTIFLIS